MAYTQADLVKAVLRDLQVLDATAAPSTEDSAAVTEILTGIVADLIARRIVPSLDTAAIADGRFPHLVRIVAERCGPRFGRPTEPNALAASESLLAEVVRLDRSAGTDLSRAVLDILASLGASSGTVDAAAVALQIPRTLASLALRKIAYYADESSIDDAGYSEIARIVAATLAPGKIPPGTVAEAERNLRALSRTRPRSLGMERFWASSSAYGASNYRTGR